MAAAAVNVLVKVCRRQRRVAKVDDFAVAGKRLGFWEKMEAITPSSTTITASWMVSTGVNRFRALKTFLT